MYHFIRKATSHDDHRVDLKPIIVKTVYPSRSILKSPNCYKCQKHHTPPRDSGGRGDSDIPPKICHPHRSP